MFCVQWIKSTEVLCGSSGGYAPSIEHLLRITRTTKNSTIIGTIQTHHFQFKVNSKLIYLFYYMPFMHALSSAFFSIVKIRGRAYWLHICEFVPLPWERIYSYASKFLWTKTIKSHAGTRHKSNVYFVARYTTTTTK